MRRRWRLGACYSVAALAVFVGAGTSLGTSEATDCFGVPATIIGTEARDELTGTPGNDVIAANGGDDLVFALAGDDLICGGPGNDSFVPGLGDDRVDGGGGGAGPGFIELVAFNLFAAGPVRADLQTGRATGEGTDTLVNITSLSGTPHADVFIGDAGVNAFFPENGDDVVDGGPGDDQVGFRSPVVANLGTGTATGEGADRLVSIESITGSDFADVLTGNGADNYLAGDGGDDVIQGAGGNDRLFGNAGSDRLLGEAGDDSTSGDEGNDRVLGGVGNDTLAGGTGDDMLAGSAGADLVSYRESVGVQANLLVGRVSGQGLDQVSDIENVSGSPARDRILGDAKTNFLFGNAGGDGIAAAEGADFLDAGGGASSLSHGSGRDYCLQGGGARRCEISGVPASVPPVPEEPPAARFHVRESPASFRAGIVMEVPEGLRAHRERVLALVGKMLRPFGYDATGQPASTAGGLLLAQPHRSTVQSVVPPGTGSFRYLGQPSCFAQRSPYRTTISPPDQIDPAVHDGSREQVFWRGVLFRRNQRSGKLVRAAFTPWATGVVQGPGVPTGFPVWTNAAQTSFVSSFRFNVAAGTYAWVGKLKWLRTGGQVTDFIEPHIVHTPKVQPDKSCTFR